MVFLNCFLSTLKKTFGNLIGNTIKNLWVLSISNDRHRSVFYWHHYQINSITYTWGIKKSGESEVPLLKELCSGGSSSGCFFENDFLSQSLLCYLSSNLRWQARGRGSCSSLSHPLASFALLHSQSIKGMNASSTWEWVLSCPSLVSRIHFCFLSFTSIFVTASCTMEKTQASSIPKPQSPNIQQSPLHTFFRDSRPASPQASWTHLAVFYTWGSTLLLQNLLSF